MGAPPQDGRGVQRRPHPPLRKRGRRRMSLAPYNAMLAAPATPAIIPPPLKESPLDYRNLGRSGLKVSPLCLGAMMFGRWGNPDHAACIRTIHRALEAGINFID